jgi:hypothetical protein
VLLIRAHTFQYRCLAHIINIATQALIQARSKTKYYNPHDIDEHTPDVTAPERDELGLIRAVSVKVNDMQHMPS